MTLRVPFRTQIRWDYCGPTSVLMWSLYNGKPEVSQQEIFNWMGGTPGGVSPQEIRNGAIYYAGVFDAILDYGAQDPVDYQNKFFARQISSINSKYPVIAIVEGGFHAGVVDGGTWTKDQTNLNVWNDVYFHDPKGFPDRAFTSATWKSYSTSGYNTYIQTMSRL